MIWSWLFPTEDEYLARARRLMAEGRHEKARAILMRCKSPEAEPLYEECSTAIDAADRVKTRKRLSKEGFHGWKVEIEMSSARRKRELEALVAAELRRDGLDLADHDVDQTAVKTAVARAQRRALANGARASGTVKLVPIVDEKVRVRK